MSMTGRGKEKSKMDAGENFEKVVKDVFRSKTVKIRFSDSVANPVICALNDNNYQTFATNFRNRLERLNKIYKGSDQLKNLISKVCNIADNKNWKGAYAELAAYDFLNKGFLEDASLLMTPITIEQQVKVTRTYAAEIGKTGPISIDGYFKDFDVFFDVKCFKDNASEILRQICKSIYKKVNGIYLFIVPEYPIDMDYHVLADKRKRIINEVVEKIEGNQKPTYVQSSTIKELSFNLRWERDLVLTDGSSNPFRLALELHRMPFNYIHQFVKDRPFFLVYLVFPWFGRVISTFRNENRDFYRSFARRIFCQYTDDRTPFRNQNSNFRGTETLCKISRSLSGLLFLEDNAINGTDPHDTNVQSYLYFNPNARHQLERTFFFDYCVSSLYLTHFDSFEYDNY
jgi:hypothetical protein